MAIVDETLQRIVAAVKPAATDASMVRVRGGLARGIAWAEISGRGADGAWYELRVHHRVHHRTATGELLAKLLAYQPLTRGGRTVVVGERTMETDLPSDEAELAVEIIGWLRTIIGWLRTTGEQRAVPSERP